MNPNCSFDAKIISRLHLFVSARENRKIYEFTLFTMKEVTQPIFLDLIFVRYKAN